MRKPTSPGYGFARSYAPRREFAAGSPSRAKSQKGVHLLGFGKSDSTRLVSWLYADRDAPFLLRKRDLGRPPRSSELVSKLKGYDGHAQPEWRNRRDASALGADGG